MIMKNFLTVLYSTLRMAGYAFGVGGLVLILMARRSEGLGTGVAQAGFILLVAMFVCFTVSYAVYFMRK